MKIVDTNQPESRTAHRKCSAVGSTATLIENAAKALGGVLTWVWSNDDQSFVPHLTIGDSAPKPWNPTTDSGGCLEMAVALKIMHRHLTPDKNGGNVVIRANGAVWVDDVPTKKLVSDVMVDTAMTTSEIQATRTAICNVAGLMGRAKK